MTNINVTNFRKEIYELLEQTIKYNEPINISTKNGNAIVLSEEDYNSLIDMILFSSILGLEEDILESASSSDEDFVSEDEVDW